MSFLFGALIMEATFLDELASAAPTPGGGGASAACGALAAALGSMVCNLTIGKQRYADVEAEVLATLDALEALRAELVALVAADAEAFAPLAAAYRMPKGTPEEAAAKEAAMQEALVGACEVPLQIMDACARVVKHAQFLVEAGSRMALSDAEAAIILGRAALQAASLNVRINVSSMTDPARAEHYTARMNALLES